MLVKVLEPGLPKAVPLIPSAVLFSTGFTLALSGRRILGALVFSGAVSGRILFFSGFGSVGGAGVVSLGLSGPGSLVLSGPGTGAVFGTAFAFAFSGPRALRTGGLLLVSSGITSLFIGELFLGLVGAALPWTTDTWPSCFFLCGIGGRTSLCVTIGMGTLEGLAGLLATLDTDTETFSGSEDLAGIGVSVRRRVCGVFLTSSQVPLLSC